MAIDVLSKLWPQTWRLFEPEADGGRGVAEVGAGVGGIAMLTIGS